MVSLDRKQRSAIFSFWRRVFICLIVFAVTYLSVIRPTQQWIIDKAIFPNVYRNYSSNQDIQFQLGAADEIFVIAGNRKFIRTLIIYQLALFFIIPFLGWFLINGQNWLSIILNFHEKAHKAGFLILGLLSIKSKADSVSVKEILN